MKQEPEREVAIKIEDIPAYWEGLNEGKRQGRREGMLAACKLVETCNIGLGETRSVRDVIVAAIRAEMEKAR